MSQDFLTDDPLLLGDEPYRGTLDADRLAEGMTVANHNAARLLEDAETLFGSQRWASAAALSIFAIEEIAKEEILRALATWPAEAKAFWRSFTSHKDKGDMAAVAWVGETTNVMTLLVITLATSLGVVGRGLDLTRWRVLYVDCVSHGGRPTWWSPEQVSGDIAGSLLETARRLVLRRVITSDEVRILIRHMPPVAGAPWSEVNAAQGRYLREVVDSGLRDLEPWMRTRLGFDPWAEPSA